MCELLCCRIRSVFSDRIANNQSPKPELLVTCSPEKKTWPSKTRQRSPLVHKRKEFDFFNFRPLRPPQCRSPMDTPGERQESSAPREKKEKKHTKRDAKDKSRRKRRSIAKTGNGSDRTSAAPTAATSAVAPLPREKALDLSAMLKLEPHRGVLSFLEQHAKEVPNQQALMCAVPTLSR